MIRNKYYQGKFQPKNPQKYAGDPTNIIYRSSWELKFLRYADNNPSIILYSSEEIVIPYISPMDKRWHRYFPDFFIKARSKTGEIKSILIEVKPYKQTKPPEKGKRVTKGYLTEIATWGVNEAKWKAAEEFCKDRRWDFKILTEKELNIK